MPDGSRRGFLREPRREQYFNLAEGIAWIGLGVYFFALLLRRTHRGLNVLIGIAFVLFGISDFVEMHTGAWWRPWWLLVWKGLCLLALLFLLTLRHRRLRKEKGRTGP